MKQFSKNSANNEINSSVVSHRYRIFADIYDPLVWIGQSTIGGERNWRKKLCKLISPKQGELIAELCCGTGAVSFELANEADIDKIYAFDISPYQIKVANRKSKRKKIPIDFSIKDASQTSYPDSYFDKVVISGAMHEIKKPFRQAIYKEVYRILKPEGYFFLSEPDQPTNIWGYIFFKLLFSSWNPESKTVYDLTEGKIDAELYKSGFYIEEYNHVNLGFFKNIKCRKL